MKKPQLSLIISSRPRKWWYFLNEKFNLFVDKSCTLKVFLEKVYVTETSLESFLATAFKNDLTYG